jgi:4-amino-4-deoxy-L-arabinose transferase-like glycosyltransferase
VIPSALVDEKVGKVGGTPRPGRWPLAIFALGLLVGLAAVAFAFRAQTLVDNRPDPYYFGAMGKSLAHGEGFTPYGLLIKRRAPLYPLMIGGLYAAFGEHVLLVQLLQCLFFATTCLLVFDLGRRLFNTRTGAIAGIVCAVHPLLLRYVADLHLETSFTFFMTLTLWLMVRFREKSTIARGAQVGAAAALASLTKALAILFPGLFAAGVVLSVLRARRAGGSARPPWVPLLAMFAVMAAVISPWTVRNYKVTGHFVPISTGMSDAFLRGYIFSKPEYALLEKEPYTDAENESNAYFKALCRDAGTEWEKDDWETDKVLNAVAKSKLKGDPLGFVRKFSVGMFTFWYEMTTLKNSVIAGGLALVVWVFAVIGWRRARQERRQVWLLLLPAFYLNLLLAALLALGRYSSPILPGLLVVAAYGVDKLIPRRDASRA